MMHSIRPRALLSGMLSGLAICAVTPFANSYLKTTPWPEGIFPWRPSSSFSRQPCCWPWWPGFPAAPRF